jgi:N-sulfoglucosamine sulfohydrolase
MAKPLNIVYIHSHDTGRYLEPYGFRIPTPNLLDFARRGTLFRNAHSTSPTCSPSRASLLTGLYPHSNGMLGLAHRGFSLYDYRQHLLHTLKKAGYTAVLIGVQHIASGREAWKKIGYDACLEEISAHTFPGSWEDSTVHETAHQFLLSQPPEPFFLSVGFTETHRTFPPPQAPADPRFVIPPAPLPDAPETRQDMAGFITSAAYLDQKIGVVLEALEQGGWLDRTLVMYTTEHGLPFPRMKANLTAHGTGVALIMRGPQPFWHSRVIDHLISQIDIFPTLCDLLQLEPPAWLQGRSFLPLLRGEVNDFRHEVFSEMTFHAAYEPARCIRTPRWSYIRRFDRRTRPVLPNVDDCPSKDLLLRHGFAGIPPAEEMLFDLVFDPLEAHNLAGHPEHQSTLHDLRSRLEAWMNETGDPLLQGPVPAPPGAVLDDPDALSPT